MPAWILTVLGILWWIVKRFWQPLLGAVVMLVIVLWLRGVFTPDDPELKTYKAGVDSARMGTQLLVYRKRRIGLIQVNMAYVAGPRPGEVYGDESRQALATRLPKKTEIEVERVKTVGDIVWTMDRTNINLQQVRDGAVWCTVDAPSVWRDAEREARRAGRGLWQYYSGPNMAKKLLVVPEQETE